MRNIPKGIQFESPNQASGSSVLAGTKWIVTTLIEPLPDLELAGYRLEPQNHGKPICSDILLNEEKSSKIKPQAWSQKINGNDYWYYNYPGACAEAKFLGKKIPTIEQWMDMFGSIAGNAEEKSRVLNIPLLGFRSADIDGFCFTGDSAYLCSSSLDDDYGDMRYVVLGHNLLILGGDSAEFDHAMPLRFLSNNK